MSAEHIRMGEAPLRRDLDCPACLAAMEGERGDVVADCWGCVARDVAGSQEAYFAFGPAAALEPLKARVKALFPNGQRKQAIEDVRMWFGVLKERRARRAQA